MSSRDINIMDRDELDAIVGEIKQKIDLFIDGAAGLNAIQKCLSKRFGQIKSSLDYTSKRIWELEDQVNSTTEDHDNTVSVLNLALGRLQDTDAKLEEAENKVQITEAKYRKSLTNAGINSTALDLTRIELNRVLSESKEVNMKVKRAEEEMKVLKRMQEIETDQTPVATVTATIDSSSGEFPVWRPRKKQHNNGVQTMNKKVQDSEAAAGWILLDDTQE